MLSLVLAGCNLGAEPVIDRVQFVVVNDTLDGQEPLTSNDELTQFNGILAGNGEQGCCRLYV